MAEHDYTERCSIKQNDEIGALAATLDELGSRLLDADEAGRKLEKLRRSFIANISHELRTPVTVIRGSLEALNDKVVTDKEEVEQYYRQMLKESLFLQERFWEAVLKVCMIYLITADIQIPFFYAKNTIFSLV